MGEQLRSAYGTSSVPSISPREEWCSRVGVIFAKTDSLLRSLDMVPFHVFLSDFQQLFEVVLTLGSVRARQSSATIPRVMRMRPPEPLHWVVRGR